MYGQYEAFPILMFKRAANAKFRPTNSRRIKNKIRQQRNKRNKKK